MTQKIRVYSVLMRSDCQLQKYIIKNGGIHIKILMSPLQAVSRSSQGQVDKSSAYTSLYHTTFV